MKKLGQFLIILLLSQACGSKADNRDEKTNRTEEQTNIESTCDIDIYLADPEIIQSAKDIWHDQSADKLADIYQTFDKLMESSNSHRPFYLLVATKGLRNHDGELAETGMEIAEKLIFGKDVKFFFDFFNEPNCLLTDNPISNAVWAQLIAYSMGMLCDTPGDDYDMCTEQMITKLKNGCPDCDMDKFIMIIKNTL